MIKKTLSLLLFGISAYSFQACSPLSEDASRSILTTTSMSADMLRTIAPASVNIDGLMGPGTDPHLYKPTVGDMQRIDRAKQVMISGFHLEGKTAEVLEGLKEQKQVYALTEGLAAGDAINETAFQDGIDPHFWLDVALWKKATAGASEQLMEWYPQSADSIEFLSSSYIQELNELDAWVRGQTARIPDSLRILITTHDAMNYFARAYGFEVKSLQGFSTAAEFGLKDVTELVDFIVEKRVPAIFVENILSDQSLKAVAEGCRSRGWDVQVGASLYTDALGEKGSGAEVYIGMMRHNVQSITRGLLGE